MNHSGWENIENNRFSEASSATTNGKNAKDILLQQSDDDQQHRFNHQYEVNQDGDVIMRTQLLEATDDTLQQDQSKMLGDMIPARMQRLTIPQIRVLQEYKACQIFRKTIISYPLIGRRSCAY